MEEERVFLIKLIRKELDWIKCNTWIRRRLLKWDHSTVSDVLHFR